MCTIHSTNDKPHITMNKEKDLIRHQIKKISFSLMSNEEIEKISVHTLTCKDLYDISTKTPASDGPLDRRLGVGNKKDVCLTCGETVVNCVGHFGNIKLVLPVFHIGLIKQIVNTLSCVCKSCGKVLLSENKKLYYKEKLREAVNGTERIIIQRKIIIDCRKMVNCVYCGSLNGAIKKGSGFKISHETEIVELTNADRDKAGIKKTSGFDLGFHVENRSTLSAKVRRDKKNLTKKVFDVNPLVAQNVFSLVEQDDYEFLGLEESPEKFILQSIIAPPACIRPSVAMVGKESSNEDDITIKLAEIIHTNNILKESLEKGNPMNIVNDDWENLQLQCALMINSDLPQIGLQSQPIKGIVQRLKGKHGRFRCNLSGKRVDFSGRTVISPNPNLKIDQVDVPEYMAKILTIPETVTSFNKDRLQKLTKNGPLKYPGANYVVGKTFKRFLLYANKDEELKLGDVVERHIVNGDVVLFNRQPSLHRMSIMAHYVNIHKNKTLRFNECVCAPYNADFDGDEMNIHVPQTVEAIAECVELMGVKQNIVTPRHGEPLISATQDFITAMYLLTSKNTFLDRQAFGQLLACFSRSKITIVPAIIHPVELFTGKQLFEAMVYDSLTDKKQIPSIVLKAKNRSYVSEWDMNDGYVVFKDGYLMFGRIDKNIVGGESKKNSLLYLLLKINNEACCRMMHNITRVSSRYLGETGFSIGLNDVLPGPVLQQKKTQVVKDGYDKCHEIIRKMESGAEVDKDLCEMEISCILNNIREECGSVCIKELSEYNSPTIMQACGSKGSKINISQMIACVGQQIISGKRIPNGMLNRTLPHFEKHSITPDAKGFVKNSFFSGLSPPEFLFHAVSGREGLVDTAVKTAETGYMQRRLMKALEDLSVSYDYSVRSAYSEIIQYKYGEDGIDPIVVESDEFVDLAKFYDYVECAVRRCEMIEDTNNDPSFYVQRYIEEYKSDKSFWKDCQNIINDNFINTLINLLETKKDSTLFCNKQFVRLGSCTNFYIEFFKLLKYKIQKSIIEPGTAVGAIAGQSIGEPGTQMTLKTFHFAGVSSMDITLGVPRLKEIINAVSNINTPIVNISLLKKDLLSAQIAKGRIVRIMFTDVCSNISEVVSKDTITIDFSLDTNLMNKLRLQLDATTIKARLNLSEQVTIVDESTLRINFKNGLAQSIFNMQKLKKKIMNTQISGLSSVNKVLIHNDKGMHKLIIEGHGLLQILGLPGVDPITTIGNGILETQEVLGIEAARALIINEIEYVVGKHGIKIDPRHIMLLADRMTFRGEVLGITRFGISKMSTSTLMLASFEQTSDHLFDAALISKADEILGVSESIILGKPIQIGTGSIELLWNDNL